MTPWDSSNLYHSLLDQGKVCGDMPGPLYGLINICGTNGWMGGRSVTSLSPLTCTEIGNRGIFSFFVHLAPAQPETGHYSYGLLSYLSRLSCVNRGLSKSTHTADKGSSLYTHAHARTHTFLLRPFNPAEIHNKQALKVIHVILKLTKLSI